jgi:hypothetical protein
MDERLINIRRAVEHLESALGVPWLKENLKSIKKAHGGKVSFGCGIGTGGVGVAPVAYLWYRAQEELAFAEMSGRDYPGPYSLFAAVIGADLAILRDCPGLAEKITELKLADQPTRAICELGLASGYLRRGFGVIFAGNGFKLRDKNILVSCLNLDPKSLENEEQKPPAVHLETAGGQNQSRRVIYLHVEDKNNAVEHGLDLRVLVPGIHRMVNAYDIPVVVYRTGLRNQNNRPTFVRKGWVLRSTKSLPFKDIYIPDEVISPGN